MCEANVATALSAASWETSQSNARKIQIKSSQKAEQSSLIKPTAMEQQTGTTNFPNENQYQHCSESHFLVSSAYCLDTSLLTSHKFLGNIFHSLSFQNKCHKNTQRHASRVPSVMLDKMRSSTFYVIQGTLCHSQK